MCSRLRAASMFTCARRTAGRRPFSSVGPTSCSISPDRWRALDGDLRGRASPSCWGGRASAGGPGPWPARTGVEEVAVIGALAWINILGVDLGGRVQGLTTHPQGGVSGRDRGLAVLCRRACIIKAAQSGKFVLHRRAGEGQPDDGVCPRSRLLGGSSGRITVGSRSAQWAQEIREPQRNIPRALFGGLGVLIVL